MEKHLQDRFQAQNILKKDIEVVKTEIKQQYIDKINTLEEKLMNNALSNEKQELLIQINEQLWIIENTIEQKIKDLELLYQLSNNSNSNSQSATEDVSAQEVKDRKNATNISAPQITENGKKITSINFETISDITQRISEKIAKHSRVEEGFVKRIHDLEMYINQLKTDCAVSVSCLPYLYDRCKL